VIKAVQSGVIVCGRVRRGWLDDILLNGLSDTNDRRLINCVRVCFILFFSAIAIINYP